VSSNPSLDLWSGCPSVTTVWGYDTVGDRVNGTAVSGNRNGFGILAILIAMTAISIQDALIKGISRDYPLHEIVLIRSVGALPFMLVLVHYERAWSRLVTSRLPLLTLRAFFVVMANSLYFVALAEIPLAEANAIFFVAPMFITILSIPMLGEKVGWYRWGAVFIGFAGVVVMLRPGSGLFQWIAISPILGALSYAMMQMMTRRLGVSEPASVLGITIHFTFILVCVLMFLAVGDGRFVDRVHPSLNFLFLPWVWPPVDDYPTMALIGVLSAVIAYSLAQAYRIAEAGLIAPFEYTALLLAVVWGFWFFGEVPDATTWTGILLIVGSGLFTLYREVLRGKPVSKPRGAARPR